MCNLFFYFSGGKGKSYFPLRRNCSANSRNLSNIPPPNGIYNVEKLL
jgi:hypothetical protein